MKIKELIQEWKPLKRYFVLVSFILSFSTLALVVWVVLLPRNMHLFKWNPSQAKLFIIICLVAVIIPLGFISDFIIRLKKLKIPKKIPGKYIYILVLAGIILPSAYLVYLKPYHHVGDKAPELMIIDQPGASGYPNLAVIFYTQKASTNYLLFGPTPIMTNKITEQGKTRTHVFVLADLIPNTQYFYQINGVGQVYNFTYFPASIENLRFAISSDPHIGAEDNNITATKLILEQLSSSDNGYNAFFCLGDIVEMGNDDSLYKEQIELFSKYTTLIPYRNIIGNHDGWFGGVEFWKEYFYPQNAPNNSSDSQLWHQYDFGSNIHIFTLDLEWGTETYTRAQREWFENRLKSLNPDDWIIVMNHAYYYSSSTEYDGIPWYDNQDMISTFQDLFFKYGVDLVFSGHNHQMEHINQNEVNYFIVGTMGGLLDLDPTYYTENSLFFDNTHFGFADLQFNNGNVTVSFRTPENIVLYEITIQQ
ncbi:MAG: metallophosphoesterase [Candidatus Heimdallarchaeum endolithica]|uniref:Metallophosphoesterase n=1 Tax=Candidatus Heimdallarchaeum endolithica TaxID=2876572 RepID=A0A9Y1BR96_9ARCH|nr:MAG: metallophosphoesterase [Candidatus Heimdallarchaeum endolithica]